MYKSIKRGQVWEANLGAYDNCERTSEQKGVRPVIILSNDAGNKYGPTVIIGIVSSKMHKMRLPVHVKIFDLISAGLTDASFVGLEQIRVIDKSKLKYYLGKLSEDDMIHIDEAIDISLGTQVINRIRVLAAEIYQMEKMITIAVNRFGHSKDVKLLLKEYYNERQQKIEKIYDICKRNCLTVEKYCRHK